ncbi:MAG: peptidase [Lachnospiraceae bacterium]|nr:peptidase [Lachnospiraceae bacterium]
MRKIIAVILTFIVVGSVYLNTGATDISDLQEEDRELESRKEQAQAVLDSLSAEQENILSSIAAIDAQILAFDAELIELQNQKAELEAEIAVNTVELEAAQAEEAAQYEAMKLRIQYSYENGDANYVDTIFTSSDVTDIVNRPEYREQIYNYDANMLNELVEIKRTVANKRVELEADLEAVELIVAEVEENKEAAEMLHSAKQAQADSYEASISEYEDEISAIEADQAALEEQIAELERQAAESGQTVQIYYNGGTFQWPVAGDGGGVITSHFGPRWGRMHNGIDIGCDTGTPIVAGESGTVIGAAYSSSMGNYVLIDHGGGVTTVYMHNSVLCVSYGQTVERGQLIAYAGSTGNSTGPHCHFGLRINGSYVNPYPYLTN